MKTLNYFKYLLFVVFAATLMVSCSDDEFSDDELNPQKSEIELRNSDDWDSDIDADCFVKLCIDIEPNTANPQFTDITTITVPGVGVWTISNNIVTLPDGSTTNVINNQYCFSIPVASVANVLVEFHGYGGIKVTGSWNNGDTFCDLYGVSWPGTYKAPINAAEELEITCESPCPLPPECEIDLCVTFIEGDPSDNYTVLLPGGGSVTIANGQVTVVTTSTNQFPLPANGEFCVTIPVFAPSTATIVYNGTGSVLLEGTWAGNITCEIFSAGQCTNDFVHETEDITLSCDPVCTPPECEIEACITFIAGDVTDNYTLILPTVGSVTIANGTVTLPSGCQFPLPADGTICTTLPIFAPTTATVIYNGTGSVEINATYEDGTVCTIFSAGANSELNLHIIEEVTLSCEAECPEIPDCYVNVCLELDNAGSDFFKVTVPGVGLIQFINGIVITPNGTFPFAGGEFCIDLPVFNGGSTAQLQFFGFGSAVVTFTYPDLLECEVFSAGVGISTLVNKKMDVLLACEGDCGPMPEFCEIEICANFSPASDDDIYQVTLASGDQITIQGGVVTIPGGQQFPYNGVQFCAIIEIEVGTTQTANLAFKGVGSVFTTIEYSDGGFCTVFSAGQGTWLPVKKSQNVTLGCDPIC